MDNFFNKFRLNTDREDPSIVIANIGSGVVFRGTNLWVLIFAIFVASLGLNLNAPAVIIGAMLISPLMGPIMGIGLSIGINDVALLRKAIFNYLVATGVALATSTLFFLISPLNEAHSEILARTAPTIYDVLIAIFGGFAGVVATSSKSKGNVIPGVAIATALMPPLCTAGYGLATFQLYYFIGAFYLFIINTVFIALATFIFTRILRFPFKHEPDKKSKVMARRVVGGVVLVTLLPSIYFGYDIVRQDRFTRDANRFISLEARFPNDYILNKKIDAKKREITIVFGGQEISKDDVDKLKSQLVKYNLNNTDLQVNQGFAYLANTPEVEKSEQYNQLTSALAEKEKQLHAHQIRLDSISKQPEIAIQLFAELKAQYPFLSNAVIQPVFVVNDSSKVIENFLVILGPASKLRKEEKNKIENWLKVRVRRSDIKLIFQ